jgi:hypothetical protein
MHPLLENLKGLTESQLENKLYTLNRMYFITGNPEVRQQMILIMDSIKLELEERRNAGKNNGNDLDDDLDKLINVS